MPEDRRAEVEQPRPTAADADAVAAQRQPLQLPAGTPPAANAALATAASVAIRQDAADQRAAALKAQRLQAQDAAAASAGDREGGAKVPTQRPGSDGLAGAGPDSGPEPVRDRGEAEDAEVNAEAGALEQEHYVHIPEDERQQLANDFLELMQVCSACRDGVLLLRCRRCHMNSSAAVSQHAHDTHVHDTPDYILCAQARFLSGEDAEVDYAKVDADASLDDDFSGLARQDAEDRYFDSD